MTLAACSGSGTSTNPNAATSAATGSGQIAGLQQGLVRVVQQVEPTVVQIETPQGLGSGIVYDASGDIVTNDHVVGSASRFRVTLADGKQYDGSLVGAFAEDDLAVIRISAHDIHPASFGDSSRLEAGDVVMAIGNPLGLRSSVTAGIVSALARTVSEGPGGPATAIPDMIQTSAAINPGNSGGALVDLSGQVIGIPTLAAVDPELGGSSAPGIGFAISSNMVTDIARQLIQSGRVTNSHRAYLGITSANLQGGGVLVYAVEPGGPAQKAGIQPGDVISRVAGKPVSDSGVLAAVLANLHPGQMVSIDVVRSDGGRTTVMLTLGSYPGGG